MKKFLGLPVLFLAAFALFALTTNTTVAEDTRPDCCDPAECLCVADCDCSDCECPACNAPAAEACCDCDACAECTGCGDCDCDACDCCGGDVNATSTKACDADASAGCCSTK